MIADKLDKLDKHTHARAHTHTQTDRLITILRSPIVGGVITGTSGLDGLALPV